MSAFERFSRPGPRHAALAPLVGEWRVAMSTRDSTGAETGRSDEVRASKRWFGGGRYVREEVEGAPHEKLTVLGYNALRDRYEYVSADNYDAVVMLYTTLPSAAGDGTTLQLYGEYVDAGREEAVRGTLVTIRTEIVLEGPDRHVLRNHYRPVGGAEYPFLESVYTRIKP